MKKVRRLYRCSYARVAVPEKELEALEAALADAVALLRMFSDMGDGEWGAGWVRSEARSFLRKHGGEGA